MKLWSLLFNFLAGSVGCTLLGWILSLTPAFVVFSAYGVAIVVIAIGAGFFLDDFLAGAIGCEVSQWYGYLIGFSIAFLCGIAVLAGVIING